MRYLAIKVTPKVIQVPTPEVLLYRVLILRTL